MIKTYLFDDIYSKFSLMNSFKTFLSIILLICLSFAQSTRDIEVYNSLKFLVPEEKNEDGNLTYMFIADPYLEEKNYDIFEVLASQYGRARAEEYFDRWISCFAFEQEVISFR